MVDWNETIQSMNKTDELLAEITRLRALVDEAATVIKPFADAAVRPVPLNLIPCSPDDWRAAAKWMEKKNNG